MQDIYSTLDKLYKEDQRNSKRSDCGQGRSVLSFGTFPGSNYTQIQIKNQKTILASALVEAFIVYDPEYSYTPEEIAFLNSIIKISAGLISPTLGFTLYAAATESMTGDIPIQWRWTNY